MKFCSKLECVNPVFGGGFCSWHQYMREDKKQKPQVKKKLVQAGTKWPIKRLSDKYQKLQRIYTGKRIIFLMENKECVGGLPGCTKEATTVHHAKGRIGNLLNDITYWKPLCMSCHEFCEKNPLAAKAKGLSLSRLEK